MTLRIQLSPSELIRFGNNLLIPIQPRGQRPEEDVQTLASTFKITGESERKLVVEDH